MTGCWLLNAECRCWMLRCAGRLRPHLSALSRKYGIERILNVSPWDGRFPLTAPFWLVFILSSQQMSWILRKTTDSPSMHPCLYPACCLACPEFPCCRGTNRYWSTAGPTCCSWQWHWRYPWWEENKKRRIVQWPNDQPNCSTKAEGRSRSHFCRRPVCCCSLEGSLFRLFLNVLSSS